LEYWFIGDDFYVDYQRIDALDERHKEEAIEREKRRIQKIMDNDDPLNSSKNDKYVPNNGLVKELNISENVRNISISLVYYFNEENFFIIYFS
jgi:hypothetical protein